MGVFTGSLKVGALAAVLLGGVFAPQPSAAQEEVEAKARVVLVPPFENFSDKKSYTYYEIPVSDGPPGSTRRVQVDSYAHSPRTKLEEILSDYVGKNFKLIERQRLDQMLVEGEFAAKSMLVDEDTAFRLGQVLGANTVVLGSIRSIVEERKTFKGYGIRTENVEVTGKINIRAINLQSMEIIRSRTFEDTVTFSGSNFGGASTSDVAQQVIDGIMEKVAEDEEFLKAIAGIEDVPEVQNVEVKISSTPVGADVLIDGGYVGNTPMSIPLPADATVTLTLQMPGHTEWSRPLKIREGMSITPTLAAE
jgi:hypothetical protein